MARKNVDPFSEAEKELGLGAGELEGTFPPGFLSKVRAGAKPRERMGPQNKITATHSGPMGETVQPTHEGTLMKPVMGERAYRKIGKNTYEEYTESPQMTGVLGQPVPPPKGARIVRKGQR